MPHLLFSSLFPSPLPPRPRIYFAPHRGLRPTEVDELLVEGWIVADWNGEDQELQIFDGVRPMIIVWPKKIYWDQALKLRALVANQVRVGSEEAYYFSLPSLLLRIVKRWLAYPQYLAYTLYPTVFTHTPCDSFRK